MSIIADGLKAFWNVFAAMSPWLLVGFLIAGMIAVWLPRHVKCIFPSAQDALTIRKVGNRISGFEIYTTEEFFLLTANGKRSNISGVEPETVSGKTHQRK